METFDFNDWDSMLMSELDAMCQLQTHIADTDPNPVMIPQPLSISDAFSLHWLNDLHHHYNSEQSQIVPFMSELCGLPSQARGPIPSPVPTAEMGFVSPCWSLSTASPVESFVYETLTGANEHYLPVDAFMYEALMAVPPVEAFVYDTLSTCNEHFPPMTPAPCNITDIPTQMRSIVTDISTPTPSTTTATPPPTPLKKPIAPPKQSPKPLRKKRRAGRPPAPDKPPYYQCPSCELRFDRRHDLARHELARHGGARDFVCEYCAKTFPRKDSLKKHLKCEERRRGLLGRVNDTA